jgi:aryl-alcohol dehydrogenase-like predicted oxidoreductase
MTNLDTQGISLPRLGLGTFRMQGEACRAAVESALALGYRHIDTAEMYGNEAPSGRRSSPPALRGTNCMSRPKSGMRISRRMRSEGRSMPA